MTLMRNMQRKIQYKFRWGTTCKWHSSSSSHCKYWKSTTFKIRLITLKLCVHIFYMYLLYTSTYAQICYFVHLSCSPLCGCTNLIMAILLIIKLASIKFAFNSHPQHRWLLNNNLYQLKLLFLAQAL